MRQRAGRAIWQGLAIAACMALLSCLTALTKEPWLVPPLASTCALLVYAPGDHASRPWTCVAGHGLCVIVGLTAAALPISALASAAIASGLAMGLMALFRIVHPPALGTAILALTPPMSALEFVAIISAGTVGMVVIAGIYVRLAGASASVNDEVA